ncbi:hypothetical protein BH11PSE8_BH11PSE8_44390 [soil metagenome]
MARVEQPTKPPVASRTRGPDRTAALEQYRRRADVYDVELALLEPVRKRAIERLASKPGDTVLDVGCGTGMSLPLLRRAVGPSGHIVGIEQSPDMIEKARQRVAEAGWRNVTLVNSPVEVADLDSVMHSPADAALFHFTHDILRQPQAVAHVLSHLVPGARVVASGLKWASPWLWPINLFVLPAALHSVTSLDGLDKPWSHLIGVTEDRGVETMLGGGVYIASRVCKGKGR